MTDEAMIEAMAQVVLRSPRDFHADYKVWLGTAQSKHIAETVFAAFLTELKQEIRREAFEEAAEKAEVILFNQGRHEAAKHMSRSIRALSERPVPTEETNSV